MKQFPQPFFQVLLEVVFVSEEFIQCPVEAIIVNILLWDAQKVSESTLAVELFCNVQLTRWFTKARDNENMGQQSPRNLRGMYLLLFRHQVFEQLTETELLDELQGKPDNAEPAAPLSANLTNVDFNPVR